MNYSKLNINIFCFEGTDANSEKKFFNQILSSDSKKNRENESWKSILTQQGIIKIISYSLKIQKSDNRNFEVLKNKINQAISTTKTSLKKYYNLFCILIDRDVKDREQLLLNFLKTNWEKIKKLLPRPSSLLVLLYPNERNFEYLVACLLEEKRELNSLTSEKSYELIKKYHLDLKTDIKAHNNINFLEKAGITPSQGFSNWRSNLVLHHCDPDYQKDVERLENEFKIKIISFAHLFNLCTNDECGEHHLLIEE